MADRVSLHAGGELFVGGDFGCERGGVRGALSWGSGGGRKDLNTDYAE